MTGKEIRLSRLFKNSGRLFTVPMDHGVTLGPLGGLKDIRQTVEQIAAGGADAIIVHKGLVKHLSPTLSTGKCELIVHLSASTTMASDPNRKELVSSVEHALGLGATAASVHVNLGSSFEPQMLRDLGEVAEQCERWGIPLLAMMYVRDGTQESEYDAGKIKHAARVAEELGADIIKVNYTGSVDTFREVTSGVKVPVIIAGGPKLASTHDLLLMIAEALEAGASGVSIGRNVFQDADPAALCTTIRKVLDGDITKEQLQDSASVT